MARAKRQLLQRIARIAEVAVPGSLVENYLTCGTASCSCHRDPDRRHGPNVYLKYKKADGRQTALYVPKIHAEQARQASDAWRELRELIAELGELNRQELRERVRRKDKDKGDG